MSKTVAELAQELGITKQYLNRILSQNNLGQKKGNRKLVSENDEKTIISILEGNIGNKKTETKKVSDIVSKPSQSSKYSNIGNKKTETDIEISFRYIHEQLKTKGKEVERLHQLLDQSQQLLLNEQKKNQLLLETKSEPVNWEKEKSRLETSVSMYRNSYNQAEQRATENYNSAVFATRLFWIATAIAGVLFVLLLSLACVHFL